MRKTMRTAAATALAGGMLLVTGGMVAGAQEQDTANCVGDNTIGEWIPGRVPFEMLADDVKHRPVYDTGQTDYREGRDVALLWGPSNFVEHWQERHRELPGGAKEYYSRLATCFDGTSNMENPPPPVPGGGMAGYDAVTHSAGFGITVNWAPSPVNTGTVTVGSPTPVTGTVTVGDIEPVEISEAVT